MEYSLQRVDHNQKLLDELRPLTGSKLQNVKDFYRVALTYTSNALEGNTLTESETKVVLEDGLTVSGHPLREIYEATGHARAYDFMWDMVDKKSVTEADIRKLHELFYNQINPAQAGEYRTEDVIITGSQYPVTAWGEVPFAMQELCAWISEARSNIHPVVFAADLHRRFVYIHPFVDGNGRTARLLMNVVLLQSGYEIIAIPPVCRAEYIAALERGHVDPAIFNGFIIDREVESQKDMMRLFHIKSNDAKDRETR